jgi:hypothetical protein
MSEAEREYIKNVDDEVLKASGKNLKKLQQLDLKTQLKSNTFYDAYVDYQREPQKESVTSTPQHSRKNKIK